MSEDHYSINEILNAVEDLQKLKKNNDLMKFKNQDNLKNSKDTNEIPINTIKLIEEAENSKN